MCSVHFAEAPLKNVLANAGAMIYDISIGGDAVARQNKKICNAFF